MSGMRVRASDACALILIIGVVVLGPSPDDRRLSTAVDYIRVVEVR